MYAEETFDDATENMGLYHNVQGLNEMWNNDSDWTDQFGRIED